MSVDKLFIQWLKSNAEGYFGKENGYYEVDPPVTNIDNPSCRVTNITEAFYGEVIVWKNGIVEVSVCCQETQETLLWEYHKIKENVFFEDLLNNYKCVLIEGRIKPATMIKMNYGRSSDIK